MWKESSTICTLKAKSLRTRLPGPRPGGDPLPPSLRVALRTCYARY